MIPIEKVKNLITKYDSLEKELASGNIDPKLFAKNQRNIQIWEILFQSRGST